MKKAAAFLAAVMLCSKYGFNPDPMFGKLTESMCMTAEAAYIMRF